MVMRALLAAACMAEVLCERLLIDLVQDNPGDAVGWQQTKYRDPSVLRELGYTGQCSTCELSGTTAIDFSSLGHDFFPVGSPQRDWLDAYAIGVQDFVESAKAAGLKAYFFVDLLVFPIFVLDAWPNATDAWPNTTSGGKVVWNDATKQLLSIMIDETFKTFPGCDGWIIREGEIYVYDTPYHRGNSPCFQCGPDLWVDFISYLRQEVCEKHNRSLFVRSWVNWPSDKDYYLNMSNQIETHPQLFFSIKHTPLDFTRPDTLFNPMIGVGKHQQIVEVELQREYEGKGAFPNYVMDGVIDGFPEMSTKVGLSSMVNNTLVQGLWTWIRGGGWWGPYIHGHENWIDLHVNVLSRWWNSHGSLSESTCFAQACEALFTGCDESCCQAMREVVQLGADSVLNGIWGTQFNSTTWFMWVRDDRIGGSAQTWFYFDSLGKDEKRWNASLEEKARARSNWKTAEKLFSASIAAKLTSMPQKSFVASSLRYGEHLFAITDAAWRVMAQGYRKDHNMTWDASELATAIADYDDNFASFRAFGLAEPYAASIYHDYYLCLGTTCSGAVSPNPRPEGIGNTVDYYRSAAELVV